jgi:hypothetical protein
MNRITRQHLWIPVAALAAGLLAVGIVLAVSGTGRASNQYDIWPDISRAGIQIAAVTMLGVLVAVAFRSVDERRTRDEQRRRLFQDVVTSYNEVKSVRRHLRAQGMLHAASITPLKAARAQDIRTQMGRLIEAQLSFEARRRELEQSDLFKDVEVVCDMLARAEQYLNKSVIAKWEHHGGAIVEGADAAALDALGLTPFIGYAHDGFHAFQTKISVPLDDLTRVLHDEIFGEPAHKHASAAKSRTQSLQAKLGLRHLTRTNGRTSQSRSASTERRSARLSGFGRSGRSDFDWIVVHEDAEQGEADVSPNGHGYPVAGDLDVDRVDSRPA